MCRAILREPHIAATPIPDNPIKDGCGWVNAVRLSAVGGAELGVDKLTCEEAAALALWMEFEVQPLALAAFGSRVAGLEDMGAYDCRNMIGNSKWTNVRSEHALANAIDISGFKLADGRVITVAKDYKGSGPEAAFLRAAHMRACKYFRVAIDGTRSVFDWLVSGDVRLPKDDCVSVIRLSSTNFGDSGARCIQDGANRTGAVLLIQSGGDAYVAIAGLYKDRCRSAVLFCNRINHRVVRFRLAEIQVFAFYLRRPEFFSLCLQSRHGGFDLVCLGRLVWRFR